jgi:hypothetical protein
MYLLSKLKSGWTTLKFIRVGLGGLILYSSIESGQVIGMIVGAFFTTISLLTDGICCTGASCYPVVSKKDSSPTEMIDYEELGTK